MAKNKTVLQTLGFAFGECEISIASRCVFPILPLGEEAVESMGVGSQTISSNRSVEIVETKQGKFRTFSHLKVIPQLQCASLLRTFFASLARTWAHARTQRKRFKLDSEISARFL